MSDEKKKVQYASTEEINEAIDKYIMGEPIQKEYPVIKSKKIVVVFQVPISGMMGAATIVLYKGKDPTKAMVENNSNLVGLMLAKYNDKDFIAEQGEKYNTVEGIVARMEYTQENIIAPVMDILVDRCKEFLEWYKEIFSRENLENF